VEKGVAEDAAEAMRSEPHKSNVEMRMEYP
jgi:hypothetical protein